MSVIFKLRNITPPGSAQAVEILARFGKRAKVIAGGTDILPLRPGHGQTGVEPR